MWSQDPNSFTWLSLYSRHIYHPLLFFNYKCVHLQWGVEWYSSINKTGKCCHEYDNGHSSTRNFRLDFLLCQLTDFESFVKPLYFFEANRKLFWKSASVIEICYVCPWIHLWGSRDTLSRASWSWRESFTQISLAALYMVQNHSFCVNAWGSRKNSIYVCILKYLRLSRTSKRCAIRSSFTFESRGWRKTLYEEGILKPNSAVSWSLRNRFLQSIHSPSVETTLGRCATYVFRNVEKKILLRLSLMSGIILDVKVRPIPEISSMISICIICLFWQDWCQGPPRPRQKKETTEAMCHKSPSLPGEDISCIL